MRKRELLSFIRTAGSKVKVTSQMERFPNSSSSGLDATDTHGYKINRQGDNEIEFGVGGARVERDSIQSGSVLKSLNFCKINNNI